MHADDLILPRAEARVGGGDGQSDGAYDFICQVHARKVDDAHQVGSYVIVALRSRAGFVVAGRRRLSRAHRGAV